MKGPGLEKWAIQRLDLLAEAQTGGPLGWVAGVRVQSIQVGLVI